VGDDNGIVKADIYFYGWGVLTRGKLSLDHVRRNPSIKTEIRDRWETKKLLRLLRL
jgi:hypothetical protein